MQEKEFKEILFEVFAAGYEAGYAAEKDLKTAFEQWHKAVTSKTGPFYC